MTTATVQIGRGYPHLIIQEAARDERFEIKVANDLLPGADRPAAFRFSGRGAVDGSGQVTATGRAVVIAGVRTRLWAPRRRPASYGRRTAAHGSRSTAARSRAGIRPEASRATPGTGATFR